MESDITQSAAFYKAWAWAEARKKQLLWGAAVILLIGAGVGFYISQQHQKQITASEQLSMIAIRSSAAGRPAAPDEFQKLAAQYPDTQAAVRASLQAAGLLFGQGNYAEAEAQFRKFLADHPSSEFAGVAALGIASSLEAQGKTEEALKAYRDITERRASDSVMPQAKLSLGRLYESQGNLAQARDTYQQLARPEFGSYGEQAMGLLRDLVSKNPSLIETQPASTNETPVIQLK